MRYSGLIMNDMSAAPGVSVSFFSQGCPHRCQGCHNPETWDFNSGKEFTSQTLDNICIGLTANGIKRNLCLMGGEPLCQENIFLSNLIVKTVRERVPGVKIYVWTGYVFEDLIKAQSKHVIDLLQHSDYLIDGPFIKELRDITLQMRGSSNQRIINLTDTLKNVII